MHCGRVIASVKKVRLTKKALAAIISVVSAAVIICALLIVNIFYPVKYLTAFFVSRKSAPLGELNMCVLDCGQADCAILTLPDGKTMLIDGGDGTYRSVLDILTELNRRDISTIDYLVCTSVAEEHCGGLAEIINNKRVGTIFYPYCNNRYITDAFSQFVSAAESSGAELVISEYGAGVQSGDFYFTFLSPSVHTAPDGEYDKLNSDPTAQNIADSSAVMWLEYAGRGIFYAGDATSAVLGKIADEYIFAQSLGQDDLFTFGGNKIDFGKCAVYKVAGHAAPSSRAAVFTDLLSPKISVISAGKNNAQGCPDTSVMSDLLASGELFVTMYDGDITVTINSNGDCTAKASD